MARRIRSIKPEILEDERSAGLSSSAWRLWVSLWLLADDFGHVRGDERHLQATVFWACPTPPRVGDLLEELATAGSIVRYQVRGQRYIEIVNWAKHQRIDNASKLAVLPGPEEGESLPLAANLGEPPRISAVRGSDLDLEREQEEERKVPALTQAVSKPKAKKTQQPKSERPRWPEVTAAYCETWKALHSIDGKGPAMDGADISALTRVYDAEGVDETIALVKRFVSDTDQFIARRGHILRDLPSRVNAYRSKQPSKHGHAPVSDFSDVSEADNGKDQAHRIKEFL